MAEYKTFASSGKHLVLRIRSMDAVRLIREEDVAKYACDHDSGLISDCGRCWDCGLKRTQKSS